MDLAGYSKLFATPRALEPDEIAGIVGRFVITAQRAEQAGFTGVQVHGAHGYLLSQFLSPLTNRRTDQWGGSLENRARLLLDVVKAIRARVSPAFCVGVKLNSADFQRGGFDAADAAAVVTWLNDMQVDLIELSGGSYESPAMQGTAKNGTLAREAYFIDFAREISATARVPVMVTGGVRRRTIAEQVLQPDSALHGMEMVGIASAMAFVPDLPNQWRREAGLDVALPDITWRNKLLAGLAGMAVTKVQLRRMGAGRKPSASISPLISLISQQMRTKVRTKRYRAWLASRPS
jgi:2,4-dienoyl-CoA reductase-like NADH-dependent reductase (Old Yellow Enzyme family)